MSGYTQLAKALLSIADVLVTDDWRIVGAVRVTLREVAAKAAAGRITPPGPVIPVGAGVDPYDAPTRTRVYRCECAKVGWNRCHEHGSGGAMREWVDLLTLDQAKIDEADDLKESREKLWERIQEWQADLDTIASEMDLDADDLLIDAGTIADFQADRPNLANELSDVNSKIKARIRAYADLQKWMKALYLEMKRKDGD